MISVSICLRKNVSFISLTINVRQIFLEIFDIHLSELWMDTWISSTFAISKYLKQFDLMQTSNGCFIREEIQLLYICVTSEYIEIPGILYTNECIWVFYRVPCYCPITTGSIWALCNLDGASVMFAIQQCYQLSTLPSNYSSTILRAKRTQWRNQERTDFSQHIITHQCSLIGNDDVLMISLLVLNNKRLLARAITFLKQSTPT